MSKASKVRDAILAQLVVQLVDQGDLAVETHVQKFWTPDFLREDMEAGPILGVRCSGRSVNSLMGPDETMVEIDVAVFGLPDLSTKADLDKRAARDAAIETADRWDGILESALDLWTGEGPFTRGKCPMAGHWFKNVTQATQYDANLFKDSRIWAGVFTVTYEDQDDE